MDFTEKMHRLKMGFRDYIQALEQERCKIQVFSKELPLSLDLITQAIEACRQQLSGTTTEYNLNVQSECSGQTTSMEGPVFEEFIPIKKRASSDCDDEDEQHSHKSKVSKDNNKNNTDKRKSDWLRSVQLWNPNPLAEEDLSREVSVMEVKRSGSGGGFYPFHKEEKAGKTIELLCKAPSIMPVVAASSTAVTVAKDNAESSKKEEKDGDRKQRRCWSPALHKSFLQALQQLGGADTATPKQIRELMKVDGLTNDEVKSHLQKYRLHTRRPSPMNHNNGNPQAAPFVLVGNIFLQPHEYTALATSTASTDLTTVETRTGMHAPLASNPPTLSHALAAAIKKPPVKKVEPYKYSEERANQSEGAVHSNSPASSSSTHTTTTSPGY
ncbi:hypothetical protein TanjilG_19207 [Lupinus angustifolius]|uniref:myb family transcription factor EFM n=1 Tax=Lupinus angustifolius TaxID=3871 RepID=UPI00090EB273|nr:PREDICTED: myb family transcription factor EFM [Lupinus angustifolius]OIV90571.1 hypothetical protein TanjilG_19207 [Lupinus angustifolius]